MDPDRDAFGRALLDHLNGEDAHSIIERDDGFVDLDGGPAVYFDDYPRWATIERRAMRYVRGDVLDVGCGAGRVALFLQERGHEVTGIDVSPLAVKVCKLRGLRDARTQSITSISSKTGVFDTIVMMGNNFGLMGGNPRAKWLLRRMHGMTTGRGRIVAGSNNVYATTDPSHRAYQRANVARGRMAGQLRLRVRYRDIATPWFDYLIVSPNEMKTLARGTGWRVSKLLTSGGSSMYVAVIDKI
jgi:SAM-dependent methyltransferase